MINAIKILENCLDKFDTIIKENDEVIYNHNIIIEELEREIETYIKKKEEVIKAIEKLKLENENR
jgi:hypothetical protein